MLDVEKGNGWGAVKFDKNVTSYCCELCSPTVLPVDASFFSQGKSQVLRAGGKLVSLACGNETLEGGRVATYLTEAGPLLFSLGRVFE